MESSGTNQGLTLQQFMFDLATNPQLQLKLAGVYKDALHKFLVEQGLSDEDAQLLANAHGSNEGRKKLAEKLTAGQLTWTTCSIGGDICE